MAIYKSENPTKDGRQYYFTVYKKDSYGNNKKYKSKKYKTKPEAKTAEAMFLLNKNNPTNIKFNILANEFFDDLSKIKKESTLYTYKKDFKNHILPYFDNLNIADLKMFHIKNWANELNKKNISVAYKNKIYNILKLIFDFAIKYHDLPTNYAKEYGRFQGKNDEIIIESKIKYISYNDFNKFISVIDNDLWKTFFTFAYYTGCRKGEIFALTWEDINFNNKLITINKTLNEEIKGKFAITSTKNNKLRKIQMNKKLIDALLTYKQTVKQYSDYNDKWFVFGNTQHLSKTTVDRYKHKYFKLANVNEITMHDFRHSHVSQLINEYVKSGQTDTTKFFIMMSDRMGHSIEVMQKTYMHLFPTVQNEIVNLLDNL